jgi:3-oxoacyl-[acyl-carrier-protein] synthase III
MSAADSNLVVVGVGATAPTWATPVRESSLMVEAALAACADAGLDPTAIDGVLSEAYSTPRVMPELHAALRLRPDVFTANTGLVGSGAVATTTLAQGAAAAGHGEVFLCVYGLNLS